MVKNRKVPIERYFNRWTSIKLVWVRYPTNTIAVVT
jgi:hypothetical protein